VAFAIAEVCLRVLLPADIYMWDKRYMLFTEGENIRNMNGFFVYQPNNTFRSLTYYDINDEFKVEYDYTVHTNNLGLVQNRDVSREVPSALFVGDSYMEGQGAAPWFYALEADNPTHYQLINGGILSNGVLQFKAMAQYVMRHADVEKVIIAYIPHDWIRPAWSLEEWRFRCLYDNTQCHGPEGFYALPPGASEATLDAYLVKLRTGRERSGSFRESFTKMLYQSKFITMLWDNLGPLVRGQGRVLDQSKSAADWFANTFGRENVLFVHLPAKDEIFTETVSPLGAQVRSYLAERGYPFFDGVAHCGMTKADYHRHDGHPNVDGYAKLKACIRKALQLVANRDTPISPGEPGYFTTRVRRRV
jgi:hypothetical protein